MQWVPPEAYPEVAINQQALQQANVDACRLYAEDWRKARDGQDSDLMWQVITRAAHGMHLGVAGKAMEKGTSRKAARKVMRDEYGPGPHREGLPETLEVRRVLRAHRHLLTLRGLAQHPEQMQSEAVQQLMDALKQDGKKCPRVSLACCIVRGNASVANIALGLTLTEAALTDARAQERAGRRDKWHAWLQEQAGRGSGAVYRWVRDGPKQVPATTAEQAADGTWKHGKKQAVEASDRAWWAIWGRPPTGKQLSQEWLEHLRDLPAYPPYAPLTAKQLGGVLRTYSPGKAAGPDGWRVKELKMWKAPSWNGQRSSLRWWKPRGDGQRRSTEQRLSSSLREARRTHWTSDQSPSCPCSTECGPRSVQRSCVLGCAPLEYPHW